MCIIHSGIAYAIHIEILIIMLLITCHNTWTELQPQCRCEFMRNGWECEWKWHIDKVMVLYLSTTGLAHTQISVRLNLFVLGWCKNGLEWIRILKTLLFVCSAICYVVCSTIVRHSIIQIQKHGVDVFAREHI